MRIFLFIVGFIFGLTIFLLGLSLLGDSLESVMGFRLRKILTRLTATKGRSVFAGLICTSLVQSSSAVGSTMVVLVDSGVLSLHQAFGIMLGANIGTTLTAQLLVFPLEKLAIPLIIMGLVLYFPLKRPNKGKATLALGAIFYGLTLTTSSLTPLLELPGIRNILFNLTDTSIEAIFFGVVLTSLVQSSSAVTGLVIRLIDLNQLSLFAGVGLALGSNIGTVITTLIASLGRGRASKATAYADLVFNLAGVLLVLPFFSYFLRFISLLSAEPERQVAHAHTVFNVVTALLAIPALDFLAKLAWWCAGKRKANKNT